MGFKKAKFNRDKIIYINAYSKIAFIRSGARHWLGQVFKDDSGGVCTGTSPL